MQIEQFKKYRCRVTPRKKHKGSNLKSCIAEHVGKEYVFEALWICEDDERYAGEWAMGCVELNPCAYWLASGDITVVKEME